MKNISTFAVAMLALLAIGNFVHSALGMIKSYALAGECFAGDWAHMVVSGVIAGALVYIIFNRQEE